jgi:hypothetical protein
MHLSFVAMLFTFVAIHLSFAGYVFNVRGRAFMVRGHAIHARGHTFILRGHVFYLRGLSILVCFSLYQLNEVLFAGQLHKVVNGSKSILLLLQHTYMSGLWQQMNLCKWGKRSLLE